MKIKPTISMILSVGGLLLGNKTEATLIHGFKCVGKRIEIIGLGEMHYESKHVEQQVKTFMRLIGPIEGDHDVLILCEVRKGQVDRLDLYQETFINQALKSLKKDEGNIPLDLVNVRLEWADIRSEDSEIFTDFFIALLTLKTVASENHDLWNRMYDNKNVCAFISSDAWKDDIKEKYEKLETMLLGHRQHMPNDVVTMFDEWLGRLDAARNTFCDLIPKQFETPEDVQKFLDSLLIDENGYENFLKLMHTLDCDVANCGLALILWDEIAQHYNNPDNGGKRLRIVMLNGAAHTLFMQRFVMDLFDLPCIKDFNTTALENCFGEDFPSLVRYWLTEPMLEDLFAYCCTCGAGCTKDHKPVWRKGFDERDYYCSKECYCKNRQDVEELTELVQGLTLNKTLVKSRRELYKI